MLQSMRDPRHGQRFPVSGSPVFRQRVSPTQAENPGFNLRQRADCDQMFHVEPSEPERFRKVGDRDAIDGSSRRQRRSLMEGNLMDHHGLPLLKFGREHN